MPLPTNQQIEAWRARWDDHPRLNDKIAYILKGDRPAETAEEAAKRMWEVNEELRKANVESGENDFEIYEGEGKKTWIIDKYSVVPILDMRGIDFHKKELCGIIIPFALLEKSFLLLAQLNGANLLRVRLEGADLSGVHIEGASFRFSQVGLHILDINNKKRGNKKCISTEREKINTTFADNNYLPRMIKLLTIREIVIVISLLIKGLKPDIMFGTYADEINGIKKKKFHLWFKEIYDRSKLCRLFFLRWFYTDFRGVKIDDADTTLAADLRRYVHDQQFLDRLRQKHPILFWLWNITTCCGWSLSRVFILSLLIIVLFALIYANAPFPAPDFMPDWLLMQPGAQLVVPDMKYEEMEGISDTFKWFFYSFDIFTNLGIRSAHPANNWGVIVVFLETIAGFSMLGLLISVMAQKLARRA